MYLEALKPKSREKVLVGQKLYDIYYHHMKFISMYVLLVQERSEGGHGAHLWLVESAVGLRPLRELGDVTGSMYGEEMRWALRSRANMENVPKTAQFMAQDTLLATSSAQESEMLSWSGRHRPFPLASHQPADSPRTS